MPAVKPTTEVVASDEIETDAALARKNIKGLLDKGGAAIDNLLLVAQESEHPRAYEVAANFENNLIQNSELGKVDFESILSAITDFLASYDVIL